MSEVDAALFDRVAEDLRGARRILAITGAGISAESGLPTYRGIGGLYEDTDPEEGIPVEVALSGTMLRARPELTWRHLARLGRTLEGATFNAAHRVLAEMERRFDVVVLTQNVDGFHRDAGSTRVIDIHGDYHHLSCMACGAASRVAEYDLLEIPPRCRVCAGLLRPDVVLFGELLPVDKTAALARESELGFDAVLSIGTTSVFPYIAEPLVFAARTGRPTVEINPGDTAVSRYARYRVKTRASVALEALWARLR